MTTSTDTSVLGTCNLYSYNIPTTCGYIVTYDPISIDKEQYEEDLARRQKEHLDRVHTYQNRNWRPCLHDSCSECHGTGIKWDGTICIHNLSCPCPKCTPYF